jgi:hypothetical protein
MANEVTPFWDPGDAITCSPETAVTGKRFVVISGPRAGGLPLISPAGAGEAVFGVAAQDAATGIAVNVHRVGVVPVTSGEALTAGDLVASDATGKAVIAGAGKRVVGLCLDDALIATDAVIALIGAATAGPTAATDVVGDQAAIADIATADGSDAATTQALANAIKAKFNTLLAELRLAGILAP